MSESESIKSEKQEHSHHHHSHHHHHHSHHHRERDAVSKRKRDAKWSGLYKPVLRIAFVGVLIILIILIVWSIFTPNEQVWEKASIDTNATEKVKEHIEKEELQAEIDSLNSKLDKYEERIDELEELLISEGIEFDSETESVSGETDNAEE